MPKFTLSKSEATILGITDAGWFDLIKDAGTRYKKTYGWGSNPLREDVSSVYQLYLDSKKVDSILLLKSQLDIETTKKLNFIMQNIISLTEGLSSELNCILWGMYCETKGEVIDATSINEYFAKEGRTLVSMCESRGINFENFITELVVRSSSTEFKTVDLLSQNQHDKLVLFLKKFNDRLMYGIEKSNGFVPKRDHNLDASKRVIVNTIQENIIRFYEEKELIPIEMVVMKHDEKAESFYPDFSSVINKMKKNYSSSELRVVYKLMEEIPDKEIRQIIRASFFLKEMTANQSDKITFKTLDNPWDSHDLVGGGTFWQKRERKRTDQSLPQWVRELIKTKEEYKSKEHQMESPENFDYFMS
ncbi:hypothetical protein [Legionella brunensis]|uniref:Uncharacterized protein n=1 Tax=Legionella brunensis TaxID=29422 RepID=A0A0W0SKI8_9GAMM|nr:hypothetical protein [Legionella brunensis]KTC83836.1 hypothetical protein Lbru_1659 [Legionella brunensis]